MRFLVSLMLLIFCCLLNIYAQQKTLFKAWADKELSYLKIDSQYVQLETFEQYKTEKRYFLLGDTLRMYDKYTSSRDNFSKQYIDYFDFLITNLSHDKLSLQPLNSNAFKLINHKDVLNFQDRDLIFDKTLKFEQIKYQVKGGAWTWVDKSFQIDRNGRVKYIIGARSEIDLLHYTGKLSKKTYREFLNILKASEVRKLQQVNQIVYDVPKTVLQINYNGQSKNLNQFILPSITTELISFIHSLPKRVKLKRSKPFVIFAEPNKII